MLRKIIAFLHIVIYDAHPLAFLSKELYKVIRYGSCAHYKYVVSRYVLYPGILKETPYVLPCRNDGYVITFPYDKVTSWNDALPVSYHCAHQSLGAAVISGYLLKALAYISELTAHMQHGDYDISVLKKIDAAQGRKFKKVKYLHSSKGFRIDYLGNT